MGRKERRREQGEADGSVNFYLFFLDAVGEKKPRDEIHMLQNLDGESVPLDGASMWRFWSTALRGSSLMYWCNYLLNVFQNSHKNGLLFLDTSL